MKLRVTIVLCLLLIIPASCKKKESDNLSETKVTIDSEAKTKNNKARSNTTIKDCDDFLDTYESWANDLITLMATYKDDPVAMVSSPEYGSTMMKGANFMQQWQTISISCASNDSYAKRMKSIQKKMENKQKELGLKE